MKSYEAGEGWKKARVSESLKRRDLSSEYQVYWKAETVENTTTHLKKDNALSPISFNDALAIHIAKDYGSQRGVVIRKFITILSKIGVDSNADEFVQYELTKNSEESLEKPVREGIQRCISERTNVHIRNVRSAPRIQGFTQRR